MIPELQKSVVLFVQVTVAVKDAGKHVIGQTMLDCEAAHEPAIDAQRYLANRGGPHAENERSLEKISALGRGE
jgi:hypothetical protein